VIFLIGAVIFVIFFLLFAAITVGMPELPPGNIIQTQILNIPKTNYLVLGLPGWILINAILNGVIFGFIIWLIFSLVTLATGSRKKKEQPIPPQQYPQPQPQPLPPQQYVSPQRPPPQYSQPTYVQTPYSQPTQPSYVPPPLTPPPQHTPPPITSMPQPSTSSAAPAMEEFIISSDNLIDKVTELLKQGNLTKIIIKDEKGKVLMEIPATVGIAGTVIAPWLAGLGGIAALVTRCTISVVRPQ
jgi:hypothetical protein